MNLTSNPDVAADIWRFMEVCGQSDQLNKHLNFLHEGLRHSLIEEEFSKEYTEARINLLDAMREGERERLIVAWEEYADALIDSIVVLVGTFHSMGLDFAAHWNEVQRANMAKAVEITCERCRGSGRYLRHLEGEPREVDCTYCSGAGKVKTVIKRADGKVLKPEGWTPPDHRAIILSRMKHTPPPVNQSGKPFEALPVTPPRVRP